MIDPRTPEEQAAAAKECNNRLKASGGHCSGCHLDYYCQQPKDMGRWLFAELLPAIDPTGQLRRVQS